MKKRVYLEVNFFQKSQDTLFIENNFFNINKKLIKMNGFNILTDEIKNQSILNMSCKMPIYFN